MAARSGGEGNAPSEYAWRPVRREGDRLEHLARERRLVVSPADIQQSGKNNER
jgi:hypothetical protein